MLLESRETPATPSSFLCEPRYLLVAALRALFSTKASVHLPPAWRVGKGQGRTEIKDMFERLRLDPESRMLGQLIQERQRATSRDLVVKQRTFLITTRMTALP